MNAYLFEIGDPVRVKPKYWSKIQLTNPSGHFPYGEVVDRDTFGKGQIYLVRHEGPKHRNLSWWPVTELLRETPLEVLARTGQ